MESEQGAIERVISRLLDEPLAAADPDRVIPTSLHDLDEILAGGLRTGQATVVASRTGEGASTFALGLARSAAIHHGVPSLILAQDALESEMVMRLISAETQIRVQRLRTRDLDSRDIQRLRDCRERLTSVPLSIVAGHDPAGSLVDSVGSANFEDDVRLVVVDAAGLGTIDRDELLLMVNRARDDHYALVVVCGALTPAGRPDRPPELVDLRNHDAMADLVDNVLMIEQKDPPEAIVHVVKQRYGPTGGLRIGYVAHTAAFVNLP